MRAHDRDPVRAAADRLGRPGHDLGRRPSRRATQSTMHDLRRRQRSRRRTRVGGDARAAPGLQQPGDVERREQQGAEVVGGRADREGRPPGRGEQLATAARRDRRDDGQQQEAGHGAWAAGLSVERVRRARRGTPSRNAGHRPRRPQVMTSRTTRRSRAVAARRVGRRRKRAGDATSRIGAGPGASVEERAVGTAPSSPAISSASMVATWAPPRSTRTRCCRPGSRARAGGWRRARRRRGRGRPR